MQFENYKLLVRVTWTTCKYINAILDIWHHHSNSRLISTAFLHIGPGRSGCDFKSILSNLVWLISVFRSGQDDALRWMPQNLTDDKSELVQVIAWCREPINYDLNQRWHSCMSQYGAYQAAAAPTESSHALPSGIMINDVFSIII